MSATVRDRVRALLGSSHPGPTVAVTTLTTVLALSVGVTPGRVVLLGLMVLAGQLSIGFSNDWIDAARDTAVGRTDKPVAQGLVPVRVVRDAAYVTLAVSVVLSLVLGAGVAVAHGLLVAGGWAYNAWLKRTRWSVAPFVTSFGALPAVATLAAPDPAVAAPWALAVGGVFGVSIHFTNVLPDLDDDARTGVAGLPHRLGRVTSGVVAFAALAVAGLLVLVGPVVASPAPVSVVGMAGAVVSVVIAAWGTVLVVTRPPSRLLFRLVVVASLLVAAQLALSGTRLSD
ncbi:UbiA family prenyltransferase [Sanguibacter suaedae]|uniref:UbiA family prenyltransferase n=1 Tax=Sanguibacter suaedae TaxID=2795737 RepID=A0A934I818_9MICO|nr:UbiA family prenyltransferase [Sanguibacter suaedae]MBI9114857.1 UbiA family prenyltransferase [Sanguibacter suaedae]